MLSIFAHTVIGLCILLRRYFSQAYCFCAVQEPTDPRIGYCVSAPLTPEQINLQVSPAPDVVVAAFVTFGDVPSGSTPIAELSTDPDLKNATTLYGVTHPYVLQTLRESFLIRFLAQRAYV